MGRSNFTSSLLSLAREMERHQRNTILQAERQQRTFQKEQRRIEHEMNTHIKGKSIIYAEQKTTEAEQDRLKIQSILNEIVKNKIIWENYIDHSDFDLPEPETIVEQQIPVKPIEKRSKYNILELILPSLKQKKINLTKKQYLESLKEWEGIEREIRTNNQKIQLKYSHESEKWEESKNKFYEEQTIRNKEVNNYSITYSKKKKEAVEFYINEILTLSKYPDFFQSDWELEYDPDSGVLIVNYVLPLRRDINPIKQVKYVISKKQFTETHLKESEIDKIYDNVLYQLSLRVTREIYLTDEANAIQSVVFNGWLTDINRSTGNDETKCILSLLTKKQEFLEVDLSRVNAKLCFLKFKGRSGVKLSELVPIEPIVTLNKEDKRFVDSYDIGEKINGINIAAMYWKDFENLIRELFEKEFCKDGAEIKITQASRDGGVDAIMFDPDPIRGGKIVIQAKRYTNVVGVSAVRDLYGTVVNEGALKGILITTANYGSDSYEFSKDKPLTLLNGSNLLHLLEKNGYENPYIDLAEAKKILNA